MGSGNRVSGDGEKMRSRRSAGAGTAAELFQELLCLEIFGIAAKHQLEFGARFGQPILADQELRQGHAGRQILAAGKRSTVFADTVIGTSLAVIHFREASVGRRIERREQQGFDEGALRVIEVAGVKELAASVQVQENSLPAAHVFGGGVGSRL